MLAAGFVVGCLLRLALFFADRPLWYDEASLALNIGTRNVAAILQPLDFGQGAPPLFLLAVKASTVLLGMGEMALRLPSLIAGLATLLIVPVIALRVTGERAGVASAWLVGLSPLLLYYSNEVKQYGQEALVTAALLLAALPVVLRTATHRQRLALTVLGAIAVWGSLPSVFVLAAIGAVLAADAVSRPVGVARAWASATTLLWSGSAAAAHLTSYRHIAREPHMVAYWRSAFLTADAAHLRTRLPEVVGGLPSATFLHDDLFAHLPHIVRLVVVGLVVALAAYGLSRVMAEHGWRLALLLVGPIAGAFVAFLFRQYPFTARLLCFAAPCLVLMAAAGFASLSARWTPPVIAATGFVALAPAAYHAALDLRNPSRAHIAEYAVIRAVEAQRREGEPVYLVGSALPPWLYYTTDWTRPDRERIRLGAIRWRAQPTVEDAAAADTTITSDRAGLSSASYQRPPYNELYAAPSGLVMQFDPAGPRSVIPTWGEREAERVRAVARPCVWILDRDLARAEFEALFSALNRAGGRRADLVRGDGAGARRMCFPER